MIQYSGFNPRARVGRDKAALPLLQSLFQFQSTRPRGARHSIDRFELHRCQFQSTRPRGARLLPSTDFMIGVSFNPRARVGRDMTTETEIRVGERFNPRARVGRDTDALHPPLSHRVSIHAPAWGATRCPNLLMTASVFQSTRPRGARPAGKLRSESVSEVSIHAPAWGATNSMFLSSVQR